MAGVVSDQIGGDKRVQTAKKRYERCVKWEANARQNELDDTKFGNADARNGYQWPQNVLKQRQGGNDSASERPCLTINKTRQHCLQIINDARQNKPQARVTPVGGEATFESAQIMEGVIRHIEYISNAQAAYDNATWGQVFGGIGYWRLVTDYSGPDTMDQDIYIRRIGNPRSVYIDPDCTEADKSDARFGFVFDDMPRDMFEATYSKFKDIVASDTLGNGDDWITEDYVRVAEYYYREEKHDELIALPQGPVRWSTLDDAQREQVAQMEAMAGQKFNRRPISTPEIKWCKIAGHKIIEETDWPGKYIPIIPVIGEETVIGGEMDRKGHVRALIDPQRMLNYWHSGAVEMVALAPKAPFIGPAAAFANIPQWASANVKNYAFLAYNHVDEDGKDVPRPERSQPPEMPQAFLAGSKMAEEEMMLASGQYQAIMGAPSNETSGKAINARQRQGDNATYHYIDRLAGAIRNTARQLIDLIPKVYDTPRVMKILAQDGSQTSVQIDPTHPQASSQTQDLDSPEFDAAQVAAIFNPTLGEYDVMADVGPAYATARQEGFNALSQMMAQDPEAKMIVGDLWAKMADFPLADQVAKRLKNMVPPQALGGPSPQMVQMQQHFQQVAQQGQQQIEMLHTELQAAKQKLADQSADLERKNYEAETNRMAAVGKIDPEAFRPIIRELVSQALGTPIVPIMDAHAAADQARMPPEPVQEGADAG